MSSWSSCIGIVVENLSPHGRKSLFERGLGRSRGDGRGAMTRDHSMKFCVPRRWFVTLTGALAVVALAWSGAAAQHATQTAAPAGHPPPAAGGQGHPTAPDGGHGLPMMNGASCSGASDLQALLVQLSAETEKARQTNSAAAMRAALESVQAGLAKVRDHMAGCGAHMQTSHSGAANADHSAHAASSAPSALRDSGTGGSAPAPDEPKAAWTIEITEASYEPASIVVKQGVKTTLTFIRRTDSTCATEVVFPDFKIEKALPLNEPVVIEITPNKAGEFRFTCGMNMYDGKMVVR